VAAPAAAGSGADFRPGSPAEFVRALWPHAEQAGRELGIDPRAIVAQAALETGWGERQIRDGDGRSSFNLFGIKADERWPGRRVGVTTLEYTDGIALPQRAQFRAYGSLAEGVADYARFLRRDSGKSATERGRGGPQGRRRAADPAREPVMRAAVDITGAPPAETRIAAP
jgi:flagellar protein FlgJ